MALFLKSILLKPSLLHLSPYTPGTDIMLWHGKTGKNLGHVDTNQLKNNMAAVSPNGRFIAAAAFTADVKVWEIVYSKDGSVKEVSNVMQLKGHKSAVTWLCFTPNSEQIITASKDGSIRTWNINVRYHLDEDPKTLKVFPIPLHDSSGSTLLYDRLSISPDGKILAATHGSTLQWLCTETGKVLDTADKAHDGISKLKTFPLHFSFIFFLLLLYAIL
ncbi:Transducin beta-like protein 2 [Vitis vinifera]|uniref:Transducin beta-like protein 2 n=1 Tax=Vitis vinifera TaxID=29760 RepID=A0A438IWT4_VITVI|nr:Transducin beta-like protein 2 [Vitis vinifera]RVX00935.1 Transducin beta-like protein 2 [Vitis vinifera]